jgi:hypothetical protein
VPARRDVLAQAEASVTWTPRLREAAWFKTGRDGPEGSRRYACSHLFVRLEQSMDVLDEWTVELRDCARGVDGRVAKVYSSEADARTALTCIYALSSHLGPLSDRFGGPAEVGRWEVHSYDLSPPDEQRLAWLGRQSTFS